MTIESCTWAPLGRLLEPASVALVGASSNPQSLGGRTLANLRRWPGRLHLVNPHQTRIDGLACYAAIDRLPEPVDCAILAVPSTAVEEAVRQCAAGGVGSVIVFASGYAEVEGPDGREAQERLAALAGAAGMVLVGPNCVGIATHRNMLNAAFAGFPPLGIAADAPAAAAPRRLALVSQSGALALALSQAVERGVTLTHVLTCGNSAGIDVADYLAWLADQPDCDAVALAVEGLREPRRLPAALDRLAASGKPVAMCRLGHSAAGREAIRFHTATHPLAGSPVPGLPSAGAPVIDVLPIESLIETASFLAKAPRPVGRGIAILSGSGGTGILAVDAADRAGLSVPQPASTTQDRLRRCLPDFAPVRNPCDVTAQSTRHPTLLLEAADALLDDAACTALLVPWGRSQSADLFQPLSALACRHGKPVVLAWMSPVPRLEMVATVERDPFLAPFASLDSACRALAGWIGR